MNSKGLLFISVLLGLASASSLFAENEPHKKGSFQVTFDKRSPLSSIDEMAKRKTADLDPKGAYQIEELTYAVTVPNDYTPSKPMGLFVWISAGDSGKAPREFVEPLAKHGFIYVGADKTGNNYPEQLRNCRQSQNSRSAQETDRRLSRHESSGKCKGGLEEHGRPRLAHVHGIDIDREGDIFGDLHLFKHGVQRLGHEARRRGAQDNLVTEIAFSL